MSGILDKHQTSRGLAGGNPTRNLHNSVANIVSIHYPWNTPIMAQTGRMNPLQRVDVRPTIVFRHLGMPSKIELV